MAKSKKKYYFRTIISLLFVLFLMPLGHALMILMEHLVPHNYLHTVSFFLGFLGLIIVIWGVFLKKDVTQTLAGLIGGLLFWTGWVEFLFQYYAQRYNVSPEIVNGEVVTKPEYLILPATFGFWAMVMTLYMFSARTGCDFLNWCQRAFFGKQRATIVAHPMTRHTSIVTFMELNMILWTSYLLLMFCYDSNFVGDHSPVTFAIGGACLVGSIFMFFRQLRIASWGHNIRFSIATVIVFWTPVEILGRVNFFKEIWIEPMAYKVEMISILGAFVVVGGLMLFFSMKKKRKLMPDGSEKKNLGE